VAGLVALVVALHAHFSWVDVRPATDLGHHYAGAVRAAAGALDSGRFDGHNVSTPYEGLIARMWVWGGPSQPAFEAVEGLWLVALAVGLALAGQAVGRGAGAVAAVAAVLLFPAFPTAARTHWIHHPEVAAVSLGLGLAAWLAPGRGSGVALGGVLGFAAAIRPSAAVWAAIPLLLFVWRCRRPEHRLPAILGFAAGLWVTAPGLVPYVHMRVAGRAANALAVGGPWKLLAIQTGVVPGALAVALAAFGASGVSRLDPVARAVLASAVAWAVGGLVAVAVTGAGPDNVPVLFVGLALLAARGAHRLCSDRPRSRAAATGLLIALGVLGPGVQLVPALGFAAPATGWSGDDVPLNFLVPRRDGVTASALAEAAARSCPPDRGPRGVRTCRVLSDRGMVHPTWEDDGALGLFLAGVKRLEVVTAPAWDGRRRVDVAVAQECDGSAPDPRARFPGTDVRFAEVVARLAPRARVVGNGCVQTWYGSATAPVEGGE
jgi:hypothetical protein